MGINAARSGPNYGVYFEKADEGLMPLQPFPSVKRKPSMQELAAELPEPRTIGERIRYLRMKRGLRQDELAESLGVYKTAVCQWEKGLTRPRPEHIVPLLRILEAPSLTAALRKPEKSIPIVHAPT